MARHKEQPGVFQRFKRSALKTGVFCVAVLGLVIYANSADKESNPEVTAADCKQIEEPVGAECTAHKAGRYLLVMHELIYESVEAQPGDEFNLLVDRRGSFDIACDRQHPKTYTIEFAPGPADESEVMYTYKLC